MVVAKYCFHCDTSYGKAYKKNCIAFAIDKNAINVRLSDNNYYNDYNNLPNIIYKECEKNA